MMCDAVFSRLISCQFGFNDEDWVLLPRLVAGQIRDQLSSIHTRTPPAQSSTTGIQSRKKILLFLHSPNIYNIKILHLQQLYHIKSVFSYKSSKNQITAPLSYWGEYPPLHLTSHRTNLEALAFCREFLLLLAVAVSRSSLVFVPSNIEEY